LNSSPKRFRTRSIAIPDLVRIKPGALDRVGIYLRRCGCRRVGWFHSDGLPAQLMERLAISLDDEGIPTAFRHAIADASRQQADQLARQCDGDFDLVLGCGGGKALDAAKYISHRLEKPYFAVPTSLSNDGFCSPQSSLTVDGKRVSIPTVMPGAVVVDTEVCWRAPKTLWLSGVGDLVAKITAVRDWKIAFHDQGVPVDDFAALLSDASVYQFIGKPEFSVDGTKLLATALMLNGVAMAVCGSSRPASGSEHLISHAVDAISESPRLHGFQVGLATYLVRQLQQHETETIHRLFSQTGFWQTLRDDPFDKPTWVRAVRAAPQVKANFPTILSRPGQIERLLERMGQDPVVQPCWRG